MKDYLPILFSSTVIVAIIEFVKFILTRIFHKHDKKDERQSDFEEQVNKKFTALGSALQMSLRNEIRQLCRRYIHDGEIDYDERGDLFELHQAYHNLGGNGNLDADINTVKDLPIKTKP